MHLLFYIDAGGYSPRTARAYVDDLLLPYHEKTTLTQKSCQAVNRMLKELGGLCQNVSSGL